ncbi:MAG: acyl-CoA dehydrogenase [Alphaproteobacteria bacterium]|nr:acyl-CoA dehydrogenase [Alphaproteobacteria bacterium]
MRFTEEHNALRASVRRFVERELNPHCDAWEEAEQYPVREVMKKAGEAGFLGITKPTEYGGMGLDYSYGIVFAEELGRIHAGGVSMSLGVQTDMATPALAHHGSDWLKRNFLAPAIAGDMISAIGVSEVGSGSDVASVKTSARKDGGDWVITGSKMWITNGMTADWICLLCNTGEAGAPHHNKSLILVPMDAKGVNRAKKLKKHGMRCSDTAQLFFDEVRVPLRHLIGEENRGFIHQMEQFQEERLFAAAKGVTTLDEAIRITAEYTKERRAFGKALIDNQWIQFTLADLATEVESLRALLYQAVEAYIQGENVSLLASMAKLKVGKLCRSVPEACQQFWGGQGYMWENRISRIVRDSRLSAIGGGANEIMMAIIAKDMGFHSQRNRK